jgi:molecular chaperone GrpE
MTSARRPAGAPDEERRPAGTPSPESEGSEEEGVAETEGIGAFFADSEKKTPQADQDEPAAALDADLDALIADVRRERDEYLELAQRARADFENYRKRAAREARDAERRGKAALARELVPALDNLERALRAAGIDPGATDDAGAAGDGEGSAPEALTRGVALVYGDLRGALERAGLETYDPTGAPFDPVQHEALATRPGDDGTTPGTVLETVERGYRLDGQVLRAARVVVSE